ncbi:MAG TPA: hypothetical protein PLW95_04305 [bacterium]|nr:hypothetical protein [bacterium]
MKEEKSLFEEILDIGYGSMRYFSKKAKKVFEEIKEEGKHKQPSNIGKVCELVKETPKIFAKRFIKNLGFVTKEDVKKES